MFAKITNFCGARVARRQMKKNATFLGDGHMIYRGSRANLSWGSSKQDIVIDGHCSFIGGILNSCHHGQIIMHEWCKIGFHSTINAVNRIEIGKNTRIATNVTIVDNNNHPINPQDRLYMAHTPHRSLERSPQFSASAPIIIGENVWIGENSRIQKGVTIGDNAIIAACSVVTKDVPANAIAAGNPARIVKEHIDQTTTPIFPLNKI